MKLLSFPIISALLLTANGVALAGTPISETRAVTATAQIDVSNVRGAVTVSAWDQANVEITGTLGSGSKALVVTGGGSRLTIKVESEEQSGWFNWGANSRMEDTILDIRVPRNTELNIETVSAEISVNGTAGRLLEVSSVSGKIRLDSMAKELEIGSVSGEIEIAGQGNRLHVETVSGDIDSRAAMESLTFETVSGSITVVTGDYREFSASSVSGDISLRGTPASDARLDLETMSGDIEINFPADLSARLEAETFSGRIHTDFGTLNEPEDGPGRSLDATIGSGSARVTIETFSGDISLRRD